MYFVIIVRDNEYSLCVIYRRRPRPRPTQMELIFGRFYDGHAEHNIVLPVYGKTENETKKSSHIT